MAETRGAGAAGGGLTAAEVADRITRGLSNDVPSRPSRTVGQIVRANVFTRFNALLGGLLLVILIGGEKNDALFGGVLISNTLIGVIQELRAKRTLDRLAVLSAPRARVLRDGETHEIDVSGVVLDDVLVLHAGDQIVVDGDLLATEGLEIDESLLTGEADPVAKAVGEPVLSGSFVAAGNGHYRATKVGHEAYAVQLAEEARRFTLVKSDLYIGIDHIVRLISIAMIPTGILLGISQVSAHGLGRDAIGGTVAGLVSMVPEGLVLLTSMAFAASVVRLGRRQVLVQELPAVETLARVDVICLDKTGTLTMGNISFQELVLLDDASTTDVTQAMAAIVATDANPNATLLAVAAGAAGAHADPSGWTATTAVPFSSARKWSGASFGDQGTWVLGAPDVVLGEEHADARQQALTQAEQGRRVLVVASGAAGFEGDTLPAGLVPRALVLLDDEIRPDAPETLQYFADQEVKVRIISGDHPQTVGAIARRAGVTIEGEVVDAATLPEDIDELAALLEHHTVFGRVKPHQKRAMVQALQHAGHVVAMTGDGVNDALALKDADIGIAMGSGSPATRATAQLVLIDGSFATMPTVVAEGRRVIANIERVANLFLVKTVYSMMLALAIGVTGVIKDKAWAFPFLPRHLTLIGSLTIGVPGFFLALEPNNTRAVRGFVSRVLHFAIPAGLIAGSATLAAYVMARHHDHLSVAESKTTAAIVLSSVAMLVLIRVASPLRGYRAALVAVMGGLLAGTIALPSGRSFFALELPTLIVSLWAVAIVAGAAAALWAWTKVEDRSPQGYLRFLRWLARER